MDEYFEAVYLASSLPSRWARVRIKCSDWIGGAHMISATPVIVGEEYMRFVHRSYLVLICRHCKELPRDHAANGKCLYAPTSYEEWKP